MTPVYKEDIEECKSRVDAWWNHEIIDRVVVQVRAPLDITKLKVDDFSQMSPEEMEAWYLDENQVFPRLKQLLANTYFGGEAFPAIQPVAGKMVAITAAYLGCPLEFHNSGTVWAHPIIEDWQNRPTFRFDPESKWWERSKRLLVMAAAEADGYSIGVPDLNGPTEVLARLRGTQQLALDFYDNPQYIKPALAEINQAWYEYWKACTAITHPTGGYYFWMGIWSDRPTTDLQSDFSCLISKKMFDEYFLPFIAEQTELVERTIYHLDGPGAVKHLDSLLALPRLSGVQWIPGAGAKPAVEWIPLLQRIQEAGKLVYVYCDKTHVEKLVHELKPEGLMLVVDGCTSRDEADALLENVTMWTKQKSSVTQWH